MTDGMNMTAKEARELAGRRLLTECSDLHRRVHYAEGVLHGLSLGRKEAERVVKEAGELYDVNDHEKWCGHGKSGCEMCVVIGKILAAIKTYKERQNNG